MTPLEHAAVSARADDVLARVLLELHARGWTQRAFVAPTGEVCVATAFLRGCDAMPLLSAESAEDWMAADRLALSAERAAEARLMSAIDLPLLSRRELPAWNDDLPPGDRGFIAVESAVLAALYPPGGDS